MGSKRLQRNDPALCEAVLQKVELEASQFIPIYKEIHQHPELPSFEVATASTIANHLERLSFQIHSSIGGHGLVGVLLNGEGPSVLLRAELDALPVEERTGLDYASTKRMLDENGEEQPVMHACGHDLHMAAVLGAAASLVAIKQFWSGRLIVLFQPNEEYVAGAKLMVEDGLWTRISPPDLMLAQHAGKLKSGFVGISGGAVLPASHNIHLRLSSSGPAQNPQICGDLVSKACALTLQLREKVKSAKGANQYATLICRRFHSESMFVHPPNSVDMAFELRTANNAVAVELLDLIKRVVVEECESTTSPKLTVTSRVEIRAPMTENKAEFADPLAMTFKYHFRERFYSPAMDPAVEDFALLGPDIPYLYWRFGATDQARWDEAESLGEVDEKIPGPHSPFFAPEIEISLKSGIEAMVLGFLTFTSIRDDVRLISHNDR
ncbi:hypothetical protein LTR84_004839 [Exophiala bonariae]|uniref:Peptidase M20 dimerisation domain-containing protein n=1 Tax=Exophiala bonariae TaxID=1690606 RepID=A0AAV9NRK2_9EURO|nr:hypothetical protein LTR84_004839 [Exophiala bonariae]